MKSLIIGLVVLAIACHADPLFSTTANNVLTGLLGNVFSPAPSSAPEVHSTTCECGATRGAETRIINGQRTTWQGTVTSVAQIIKKQTNQIHAGGSLISPRHVLTVAHAFMRGITPDQIYVAVGNPYNEYRTGKVGEYTQKVEVEKILTNDYTGPPNRYNDIAILVLKNPVELNQFVRVACLPKDNSDDLAGQTALIAGWGHIRNDSKVLEDEIRTGRVTILNAEQCNKAWSSVPKENPKQFCVDSPYQRAAQGDSGGPVQWYDESIKRYVNMGVISYGAQDRDKHYPRVNTDVSEYLEWIKFVVNSTTQDQICTKR